MEAGLRKQGNGNTVALGHFPRRLAQEEKSQMEGCGGSRGARRDPGESPRLLPTLIHVGRAIIDAPPMDAAAGSCMQQPWYARPRPHTSADIILFGAASGQCSFGDGRPMRARGATLATTQKWARKALTGPLRGRAPQALPMAPSFCYSTLSAEPVWRKWIRGADMCLANVGKREPDGGQRR